MSCKNTKEKYHNHISLQVQALTNHLLSNVQSYNICLLPNFCLNICTSSLSKKCLTCIPCWERPIWQISQLRNFAISWNVNLSFKKNWTTSFPGPFNILCGKRVLKEKNKNLKNVFSKIFVKTLHNKLLLLPKNTTHNPLNEKTIWLKFLFTSFF